MQHNQPRYAIAYQSAFADLDTVQSYLPTNYIAVQRNDAIFIEGYDRDGWTLDGYVIPRLASALIVAKEVFDHEA